MLCRDSLTPSSRHAGGARQSRLSGRAPVCEGVCATTAGPPRGPFGQDTLRSASRIRFRMRLGIGPGIAPSELVLEAVCPVAHRFEVGMGLRNVGLLPQMLDSRDLPCRGTSAETSGILPFIFEVEELLEDLELGDTPLQRGYRSRSQGRPRDLCGPPTAISLRSKSKSPLTSATWLWSY
jgi:hypothetical protein